MQTLCAAETILCIARALKGVRAIDRWVCDQWKDREREREREKREKKTGHIHTREHHDELWSAEVYSSSRPLCSFAFFFFVASLGFTLEENKNF